MNTRTKTNVWIISGVTITTLLSVILDLYGVIPGRYSMIVTLVAISSGLGLGKWFARRDAARNPN